MLDLTKLNPFGRLEAIRPLFVKDTHWVWLCRCKCGKTCEVKSTLLRRGSTNSCGCIRQENARKNGRQQRPRVVVTKLVEFRRLGFTYRALGRLFKMSPSRCCRLVHSAGEE